MKKISSQTMLKVAVAPTVLGLALLSTPAFAQDDTEEAATTDTIIVTGSLIRNPNLQSTSPVNVTTADEIELQQANVAEELLREVPGIVPSIGSAVNNGNGGNSYVNLRGLGSNRNVVLLDGVRVVPADLAGRFDLNNIPLALIERVDVLTGGASTTYGADAISGVVNFITRRDFAGVEANGSLGITDEGDGKTVRFDVTTGANFDDGRGNVVLGIGYQKADPVYQGQRKIGENTIGSYSGAAAGSGTTIPTRLSGGGIPNSQVNADGTAFRPGHAPYNFSPANIFQTPFERYNIYAAGRYEISDAVEVYSRGLFSKNTVDTIIAPSGAFGIAVDIPVSNPFLAPAMQQTLCNALTLTAAECTAARTATDPNSPAYREVTTAMFRRAVEVGPRNSNYANTVFDYRVGLTGPLTDSISWDIWGSYGQADQVQSINGYLLNSRIRQSLLTTQDSSGNFVCQDTSNNCVPVDWFSASTADWQQSYTDFLTGISTVQVYTTMAQANASISGDFGWTIPFAYDPVSFAVAGEYRKYTARQQSDALAESGDLGGAGGAAPNITGGYDVYEAIGELVVPIVSDKPFFHELSLQAGVRYSSYTVDAPSNPSYDTTTWKIQGTWAPIPDITIRGGFARAVRAPNIGELFSPVTTGLVSWSEDACATFDDTGAPTGNGVPTGALRDVCILQGAPAGVIGSIGEPTASQARGTSGGNINLGPETSDSYTIGVILQPSFIPGLTATIDYYNIEVTDAVSSPAVVDVYNACFDNPSVSNPACGPDFINRDPLTGQLSGDGARGFFLASSNLGYIKTDGIDLTVNYNRDIGFGRLSMAFVGSWTNSNVFQSTPSSDPLYCVGIMSFDCGSLQPEYQWSLRTTLSVKMVDLSVSWRHLSSMVADDFGDRFVGTPFGYTGTYDFNKIDAYDYFDTSVRFNVNDNLTLTGTVSNVFDKDPPLIGADAGGTAWNSGNTFPSTYDAVGRRFSMGAKLRF